jgi:hypothetical protein
MSEDSAKAVVKYEMKQYQIDGQLHIELDCIFNEQRMNVAHWVADAKSQMLKEYLVSLGWTPPAGWDG